MNAILFCRMAIEIARLGAAVPCDTWSARIGHVPTVVVTLPASRFDGDDQAITFWFRHDKR